MALPGLYLEGLTQQALRGREQLNTYKVGLIEAILKEALRADEDSESTTMRSAIQTALEVARWELRSAGR
jgi:hypothetical protein